MKIRIVFMFILLNLSTQVTSTVCGPYGQCSCNIPDMCCRRTRSTLADICGSIKNNITRLQAEQNNFKNVTRDDLHGCQTLESLSLNSNGIRLSDNCTFCALKSLEYLDLSNNEIEVFDWRVSKTRQFSPSLKVLKINNNLNNTFDSRYYPDFSYLKALNELFLDGLPDKIFPDSYKKMVQLKTLVMSGRLGKCNMMQISNETLRNLGNIKTLNLSACSVEIIYAGAFQEMHHLENLDLSYNYRLGFVMLENITYGLQYTKIKSLNVSQIHSTFGLSTELRLQDVCYMWNTSIVEFVVSRNRIELFESNVPILISRNLQRLHADENKFTFGPYLLQLGCLSKLQELSVNNLNIAFSPDLYFKEPNDKPARKRKKKSTCPFMKPGFLRNVSKSLKYCNFVKSDDKKIGKSHYPMFPEALKIVNFASSNMKFNIPSYLYLPLANQVEYADFSGNVLYAVTGPFGPFPNLLHVDLSRNYLSFLGLNLSTGLKHVRNLQLNQNLIGLIFRDSVYGPRIFNGFYNVQILNLSANIISYFPPEALSDLGALEVLDLSVNNIEAWTIDVGNLHNLIDLRLQTNHLQTLPSTLMWKLENNSKRLKKPFSIDLRDNAIKVTCEGKEFLKWMFKHEKNFKYFNKYNFQNSAGSPITTKKFKIMVKNLEKTCSSYTIEIVFGTIGVSVFLAIILGGFIYRHRWNLRYLLRITKVRKFDYRSLQNEPSTEHFMYEAFISYADEDKSFVLDQVVHFLEGQGYKVTIHTRDFVPGTYIADNIVKSVQRSRKTIAILSEEYLTSAWCQYEFNMARMESIYSRAGLNCLIVILYKEVQLKRLTTEMLQWIRTNTYLEYTEDETGELLFWESLLAALRE